MHRLLVCHFLLAAFCLISAAPTKEECEDLTKPLSMKDHTVVLGEATLLLGFADHPAFVTMLEVLEKSHISVKQRDGAVVMDEVLKINGTCFNLTTPIKVNEDGAVLSTSNFTSVYHMLPSGNDSWAIYVNSSGSEFEQMARLMNLNIELEGDFKARGLYFYAKDVTAVTDADQERFLLQAGCLGFTGNSTVTYDEERGRCDPDAIKTLHI